MEKKNVIAVGCTLLIPMLSGCTTMGDGKNYAGSSMSTAAAAASFHEYKNRNSNIYNLLIDSPSYPPKMSNLLSNDPLTVKELKEIIKRNEGLGAKVENIKLFRQGAESVELPDDERVGVGDTKAKNLIVRAPY